MAAVVEFKNVTYRYPLSTTPAIKNLNLSIQKGKIYGVVGVNGSGKTTLCALIGGFAPSFFKGELEGKILVNGISTVADDRDELSFRIGYVFQNPFNQISGVKDTVFEEIAFGLENLGIDPAEIEPRVITMMEKTNILHLAEKNPFELSGGQQQRVALASILVMEPDLYIIDEPTSQLDPESTEDVFRIIEALKKEQKTVVLVEHKVDLMAEYADEIIVLADGELLKNGSAEEVLSDLALADCGIQLPQMAILGGKLREKGMPLPKLPITERQAVEMLKGIFENKGGVL